MEPQPNHLKIIQGLPGHSRNIFIKKQTATRAWPMYAMVCSDEQYTEELLAEYNANLVESKITNLNPSVLCFRRVVRLITGQAPFIIVNSLNSTVVDVAPYVALAEAFGYEYEIVYVKEGLPDNPTPDQKTALSQLQLFDTTCPQNWNRVVFPVTV